MWVAIAVVAVILLIIGVLLLPARPASDDGPLPLDIETQVLLGEAPEPPDSHPTADDDDARR
jgi:hypothetical protein